MTVKEGKTHGFSACNSFKFQQNKIHIHTSQQMWSYVKNGKSFYWFILHSIFSWVWKFTPNLVIVSSQTLFVQDLLTFLCLSEFWFKVVWSPQFVTPYYRYLAFLVSPSTCRHIFSTFWLYNVYAVLTDYEKEIFT